MSEQSHARPLAFGAANIMVEIKPSEDDGEFGVNVLVDGVEETWLGKDEVPILRDALTLAIAEMERATSTSRIDAASGKEQAK